MHGQNFVVDCAIVFQVVGTAGDNGVAWETSQLLEPHAAGLRWHAQAPGASHNALPRRRATRDTRCLKRHTAGSLSTSATAGEYPPAAPPSFVQAVLPAPCPRDTSLPFATRLPAQAPNHPPAPPGRLCCSRAGTSRSTASPLRSTARRLSSTPAARSVAGPLSRCGPSKRATPPPPTGEGGDGMGLWPRRGQAAAGWLGPCGWRLLVVESRLTGRCRPASMSRPSWGCVLLCCWAGVAGLAGNVGCVQAGAY